MCGDVVTIIAAIDDNHNGDPELAKRLIDIAADIGCNAVKFISRTVDLSAPRAVLDRPFRHYPSLGETLREVRERLTLSAAAQAALVRHAVGRIDYMIAPRDVPSAGEAQRLRPQALQVDESCVTHTWLLEEVSRVELPVYAAVGSATDREVSSLLGVLAQKVTLLHTIDGPPGSATLTHLRGLEWLRTFGRPVGHSDSEASAALAVAAAVLGATVVEKRLTLDRTMDGPDHARSLMPAEFREMVLQIRDLVSSPVERIRGQILSWHTAAVDERPSIVTRVPIPKGTVISSDMLQLKPPQRGLSPRMIPWVTGRRAAYDIDEDEFVTFGLLEGTA